MSTQMTEVHRKALLDTIDIIFREIPNQEAIYLLGYYAALDGENDNPYEDPINKGKWDHGHKDGVLVQAYIEGEFDE